MVEHKQIVVDPSSLFQIGDLALRSFNTEGLLTNEAIGLPMMFWDVIFMKFLAALLMALTRPLLSMAMIPPWLHR